MKKLFTIMIILIIASAVFAEGVFSFRGAGAFDLTAYQTPKNVTQVPVFAQKVSLDRVPIRGMGFGFDAGLELKLSEEICLYGDFSMTFPSKVKIDDDHEVTRDSLDEMTKIIKDMYSDHSDIEVNAFLTTVSAHLGFARALNLGDSPFRLNIGGGVGYTRTSVGDKTTMVKANTLYHMDDYHVLSSLSADLYVNAAYKLGNHFSVGAVIMPGFVFFSSSKLYCTVESEYSDTCVPVPSNQYYSTDSESKWQTGMKPKYENSGFCAGFSLNTAIGITYHF